MMKSFIEHVIEQNITSNELLYEEFDDYVEIWHTRPDIKGSLHDFLGLTRKEYGELLKGTNCLAEIVHRKKNWQKF